MRITIGVKVFGAALGLLALMAIVAYINMSMSRRVERLLTIVDEHYIAAFASLADAEASMTDEGLYLRDIVVHRLENWDDRSDDQRLLDLVANATIETDRLIAEARKHIVDQIQDPEDFHDNVDLGRIDARLQLLQEERVRQQKLRAEMMTALKDGDDKTFRLRLNDADKLREVIDKKLDEAQDHMRDLVHNATLETIAEQSEVVRISVIALAIAVVVGLLFAGVVTINLVRPVRRLVNATEDVEKGNLDTEVPVTTRDEIGKLTKSFNHMVKELRVKAQIRETFGKYVDPRIVQGLIDRPDLAGIQGDRRVMTVLFCDMKGFTPASEGMTPPTLVKVINQYLTSVSQPVRAHDGIVDKYIGDALMAYWGPPFNDPQEQARLACEAALDQIVGMEGFRRGLVELIGVKRGLPDIDVRIGIATGDVVVGNIGSDVAMSYTLIGDTVNLASRLEGASKLYGTRVLLNAHTAERVRDTMVLREIDSILVVGKSEPERIFELLGRVGQVPAEVMEGTARFAEALEAYRGGAWDKARADFEACRTTMPGDKPSAVFLTRIEKLKTNPPAGWNGVWTLSEK
ncbi:MAG: adenylate/guanylate cyclase domain-containing protein [Alphaproteobacteria bacterium]